MYYYLFLKLLSNRNIPIGFLFFNDAIKVASTNLSQVYFFYFEGSTTAGYCVSFINNILRRRYDFGLHIKQKECNFGYWDLNSGTYTRLWTISAS